MAGPRSRTRGHWQALSLFMPQHQRKWFLVCSHGRTTAVLLQGIPFGFIHLYHHVLVHGLLTRSIPCPIGYPPTCRSANRGDAQIRDGPCLSPSTKLKPGLASWAALPLHLSARLNVADLGESGFGS